MLVYVGRTKRGFNFSIADEFIHHSFPLPARTSLQTSADPGTVLILGVTTHGKRALKIIHLPENPSKQLDDLIEQNPILCNEYTKPCGIDMDKRPHQTRREQLNGGGILTLR